VYGKENHPYSIKLTEKLKEAGFSFRLENRGLSGEFTDSMVSRFAKLVESGSFNFAVILGGTNDLGLQDPEMTFGNLKAMHDHARKMGIISVVVTIPENGQEQDLPWIAEVASAINNKLKQYCNENKVPLIDLRSRLPRHSLTPDERKAMWCDQLHFTEYGYDCFGELVYETLAPLLIK